MKFHEMIIILQAIPGAFGSQETKPANFIKKNDFGAYPTEDLDSTDTCKESGAHYVGLCMTEPQLQESCPATCRKTICREYIQSGRCGTDILPIECKEWCDTNNAECEDTLRGLCGDNNRHVQKICPDSCGLEKARCESAVWAGRCNESEVQQRCPGDCHIYYNYCRDLARRGLCETNQQAQDLCPDDCREYKESCQPWALSGRCVSDTVYRRCPEACRRIKYMSKGLGTTCGDGEGVLRSEDSCRKAVTNPELCPSAKESANPSKCTFKDANDVNFPTGCFHMKNRFFYNINPNGKSNGHVSPVCRILLPQE